ncbi:MAG: dihydrolipoamide acetyltransferase family protein [Anaerolineae bacterium]
MPVAVIMPKFEMAQEAGTVVRWLKREGDAVQKGDALLEIETDKAIMEVEALASGTLAGVRAQPGETYPVGAPIAYLLQPGESWSEPEPPADADRPAKADAAPARRATPVAARMARSHDLDLAAIAGSGPGGRVTRGDVAAHLSAQSGAPAPEAAPAPDRVKAVPAARRLARERGVDLHAVAGTGPGGRIQSADVHAAQPGDGRPAVRRRIPLSNMRRTIAQRTAASAREAPQFALSVDADMGRALAIVEDLRAEGERDPARRVTLTAFLVRACAWALDRHPAMNASFAEDHIIEWAEVNIGVAVAVDDGLVAPVLRRADRLSLLEIAAQLNDLTARARARRLALADLQGGTFTLSNLGMFGVTRFTAILNPPEAGILAVGRVIRQPVAAEGDAVIVRPVAALTLTVDHRAVDGAIAGRFLADLQRALEHPGVLM